MRFSSVVFSLLAAIPFTLAHDVFDKTTAICDIYNDRVSATFILVESREYTAILVDVESGLNVSSGGWPYHIHESPVKPGDFDTCLSAGPHFDPFNKTEAATCTSSDVTKCQVGDLAGRYGNLQPDDNGAVKPFAVSDAQIFLLSKNDPDMSVIGRSIVIHKPDLTRYACCNIYETSVRIY